jgi:hypothetical protein
VNMEVTIEIREGRYFSRIWFIEGKTCDWLGALWRDLPDGQWNLTYRFRYDNPRVDDPTGGADEKRGYHVRFHGMKTEPEVLADAKFILTMVLIALGGPLHTLLLSSSNTEEIFEQFKTLPGTHVREIPL